jgi:hypothetical protein
VPGVERPLILDALDELGFKVLGVPADYVPVERVPDGVAWASPVDEARAEITNVAGLSLA